MASIVPIVEGQGEVEAVPELLRRILHEMNADHVTVLRPFRVKRNQVVREGKIERAVRQALRDREEAGGIMVILDSDDDCPAELGPQLLERCRNSAPSIPVVVILAHREFESWFLGAKESLRGRRGIREDATISEDPEGIRGAKKRLSGNMEGARYLEVDDQPAFAAVMDLETTRMNCPSFAKLVRDVEHLVSLL